MMRAADSAAFSFSAGTSEKSPVLIEPSYLPPSFKQVGGSMHALATPQKSG